jgi:hypothetical protein
MKIKKTNDIYFETEGVYVCRKFYEKRHFGAIRQKKLYTLYQIWSTINYSKEKKLDVNFFCTYSYPN